MWALAFAGWKRTDRAARGKVVVQREGVHGRGKGPRSRPGRRVRFRRRCCGLDFGIRFACLAPDRNQPMDKVRLALMRSKKTLAECKVAMHLFEKRDESARTLAAKTIIILGRSVTFALQGMSKVEPRFYTWYAPYQQEMKNDPLFRFFKNKRNGIVHETEDIDLSYLSTVTLWDPAPGAIDAVINDGSFIQSVQMDFIENRRYAIVITPDGRREERDVRMRSDKPWWENAEVRSYFLDAPIEFSTLTVIDSCVRYLEYLEAMINDAEKTFGKEP